MMNFKKRLSIQIEDTKEDEEDVQMIQINNESKALKFQESPHIENQVKFFEDDKHKIMDLNNTFVNGLLSYMENENSTIDLSYAW
jgi:hypothetical protein